MTHPDPHPSTIAEMDKMLAVMDDQCVAAGLPILSVVVQFSDGRASNQFWRSVEKHRLRQGAETDEAVRARILQGSRNAARAGKYAGICP